jgi:hypothetical protein
LDPREFILLAEDLLKRIEEEDAPQPSLRTVVNRAYLGALLFSADALERFRIAPYPRDVTFYGLVENDLYDNVGGRLRERLNILRSWRTRADYELTEDIDMSMSVESITLANELVVGIQEKLL